MLTKQDKNYIEGMFDKKIDDFAIIMKSSFDKVFEVLETKADKEDIDKSFKAVDERFDKIYYRLDVLEYKIIGGQGRRLDKIEDDVRTIKTSLKLQ